MQSNLAPTYEIESLDLVNQNLNKKRTDLCFYGVNSYFIGQRQTVEEALNNSRPDTNETASHYGLKIDTRFR